MYGFDISSCYTLLGPTVSAGQDLQDSLCIYDAPSSLHSFLSTDATPGGTWYPLTSIPDLFTPGVDPQGLYTYIVDDPYCDPDTSHLLLTVIPSPPIYFEVSGPLCPGESVTITIGTQQAVANWLHPPVSGSDLLLAVPQIVYAYAQNAFGCAQTDSLVIEYDVGCALASVYVPNVFSPNRDGINDTWEIFPSGTIDQMTVSVFDRWGNLVFFQTGSNCQWNGEDRYGAPAMSGVYTYTLEVIHTTGVLVKVGGDVTLLR